MTPRISVVICTLNEAENLPSVLPYIPKWVYEVIIVDGHSTDNTVEVVHQLLPDAKIVTQVGKGKGNALRIGFLIAAGDIIVTMDADGACPPNDIVAFITCAEHGWDFVKGSRFKFQTPKGKPRHRIFGNWLITVTFNILFNKKYTDLCSGYNAFWREKVLKALELWPEDGFENEPWINSRIAKTGLRVCEVGYIENPRLHGEVKETSWRQGVKAIKSIARERFSK